MQGYLTGYYFIIPVMAVIVITGIFRIRHMVLDLHRTRRGLQQFFTCHGNERWGPPLRVKEWQRNAVRHLIAQHETLDNDIWQLKNRRNNLSEMEKEEQKRLSELILSELNSRAAEDLEKSLFLDFEISRSRAKIEDVRKRIREKDTVVLSMEKVKLEVTMCLKAYIRGGNPRLPVKKYIRGLFFDLR